MCPKPISTTEFWQRFEPNPNGCWVWQYATNSRGYGIINFHRQSWLTHRLAYTLAVGDIPNGMAVCHTCDTPTCGNPAHLWIGTPTDNNRDRHRKGRSKGPAGEKHGAAILSGQQVIEIRNRITAGDPMHGLAIDYGVAYATIKGIKSGRKWKHLLPR